MNKNFFVVAILLHSICFGQQSTDSVNPAPKLKHTKLNTTLALANNEFANFRYAYAIPLYKSYINKHANDTFAIKNLAVCYRMNNEYDSAIFYYNFANKLGVKTGNNLPELYAIQGRYQDAITSYQKILADNLATTEKENNWYQTRLNGFVQREKFLRDSLDYQLSFLKINTSYNEFAAALYDSGLVFESNRSVKIKRKNEFGWDGNPFTKLYYKADTNGIRTENYKGTFWQEKQLKRSITSYSQNSSNDNNTFFPKFDFKQSKLNNAENTVSIFSSTLDSHLNNGSICFTSDGKTAYFTKNQNNKKGENHLELWSANLINGIWSNLTKLSLNNELYSLFHPAISHDGKRLYFVSDAQGGMGGTDIYFADKKEDGEWDKMVNLSDINSCGNELFPTFYEDKLFFSSNGFEGLGGLDIYEVSNINDKNANSIKVKNLGFPINSNFDEIGFSIRNKKGYFSSNRYGSDDIFIYDMSPAFLMINGQITINDKIVTDSLNQITVKLLGSENFNQTNDEDSNQNKLIESITLDKSRQYNFKVRPNRSYQIVVEDKKGNTLSKKIVTNNLDKNTYSIVSGEKIFKQDLELSNLKIPVIAEVKKADDKTDSLSKSNQLKNYFVYYDLDKSSLDKQSVLTLDSLIVDLKNNIKLNAVIGSFTDCAASMQYNLMLSKQRSKSVIDYLSKNGIAKNRISERHYGKLFLKLDCAKSNYNKDQQIVNRRSEIFTTEEINKTWDDFVNPKTNGK
jgi:outer membrane protein OmpA-like peptidoglycan-associated protein/tetratricopeptide (TPR) repeat protein